MSVWSEIGVSLGNFGRRLSSVSKGRKQALAVSFLKVGYKGQTQDSSADFMLIRVAEGDG